VRWRASDSTTRGKRAASNEGARRGGRGRPCRGAPLLAALVRDDGRLVGIVNRYDVLREVAGIG
jgi:CBS domain-containing protein